MNHLNPTRLTQRKHAQCKHRQECLCYLSLPLLALTVLLASCATHPPAPPPTASSTTTSPATPARQRPIVSSEATGSTSKIENLLTRTLSDPALHRFLADPNNLGRDPAAAWDCESLQWAAFYFNPALDLARAQYATAQTTARYAGQRPNPTLSLIPGYDFTHHSGLSPWMPAISLDWLFTSAKKLNLAKTAAQADADSARLAVLAAAWQVRSDLRRALLDHASAARHAEALAAQAGAQRAILALLEQRQAAGSITATEVSAARASLLRAESATADARAQQLTARARAAAALGIPAAALADITLPAPPTFNATTTTATAPASITSAAQPPLASPSALQPFSPSALSAAALHARADILIALARYQSARAALALELARRHTDINLGPGYQWDQGDHKFTFTLALEIPLFHKINDAQIAAAAARCDEAAAQVTLLQSQILAAIDSATAAQQSAAAQLATAQTLRDELRAQAQRAQQRHDIGAADQLELQLARLDALSADTAVLDAELASAAAAGDLEDALQIPFPNLENLPTSPRDPPPNSQTR